MSKKGTNKKPMNQIVRHIISIVLTAAVLAVVDYIMLPAYNIQSPDLWFMVIGALLLFGVFEIFLGGEMKVTVVQNSESGKGSSSQPSISFVKDESKKKSIGGIIIKIAIGIAIVAVIISLLSSVFFNAKGYAAIAGNIEERNFIEDFSTSENISNIALMDSNGARIIGARALGSLSDLVSQFEAKYTYTQINLAGKPMKVSPLEYAESDFFKWWNNRNSGIPGYIAVDPVSNTSNYIKLDESMKYAESAYFNQDLKRKLRFSYRTAMFGNTYFEIDENGTPFYITPVLKHKFFLFGGTDVKGVVTLNPCTGETAYYDVEDVPTWIDIVYDGNMLAQRYDWHGIYSGGYINSIFGNRDCKRVTDDFGYKMFDDDVWIFTGVTSLANDESNIGFVLMNSRTSEIRYYAIPGAEEYSVMRSAEGEVQHLGYTAAFPSVVNVEDQPTYIMVLKDKGGLVKQYALIHVERYNIVVTATTQREVMVKYKLALSENGMIDKSEIPLDSSEGETIKVADVTYLVQDGNSYAYIVSDKKEIFKLSCAEFEEVVLVKAGDTINLTALEEESGIRIVISLDVK